MTTSEMLVTLSVDDLLPGDSIRLLPTDGGDCTVLEVQQLEHGRRIVVCQYWREVSMDGDCLPAMAIRGKLGDMTGYVQDTIKVWLWKYSRVEVLSDVSDRGALAISQHAVPSEATEEAQA